MIVWLLAIFVFLVNMSIVCLFRCLCFMCCLIVWFVVRVSVWLVDCFCSSLGLLCSFFVRVWVLFVCVYVRLFVSGLFGLVV